MVAKKTPDKNLIISKIVQKALEIDSTKADLVELINQLSAANEEFGKIVGTAAPDDIKEIRTIEKESLKLLSDTSVDYDKEGSTIKVKNVEKSKKLVELYVKEPTREEARYFADLYYQVQDFRIAVSNQISAIDRGQDQDDKTHKDEKQRKNKNLIDTPATMAFRHHLLKQLVTIENDIKAALSDYSDRIPMGKYAKQIVGIGPVFATVLCSGLEIPDKGQLPPEKQQFVVGNWISYVGLNDNNRPWIKSDEDARRMVTEAIEENAGIIDDDAVRLLCAKTLWTYEHYYTFCCDRKTGKFKGFTKEDLVKATKLVPYNKNLKKTMYLIGQSFQKVQNKPNSLYGRLYKERLQYEINRNEDGYNKDYAAKSLKKKNYSKSTETYKAYVKGKCPKGQLINRATRHTVKIFLNHLFEFEYLEKFDEPAPIPYAFTMDGIHKDYIEPEVPYDKFLTKNQGK